MSQLPAWHGLVIVGALVALFGAGLVNHTWARRRGGLATETTKRNKR